MKKLHNLEVKHRAYYEAITRYGTMVLNEVLHDFKDEQMFEQAQNCKDVLEAYCGDFNIDVPKQRMKDDEDYVVEFWRLGLSGNTALLNLPFYIEECKKLISKYSI